MFNKNDDTVSGPKKATDARLQEMQRVNRFYFRVWIIAASVLLLVMAMLLAGAGYVAVHFISKHW